MNQDIKPSSNAAGITVRLKWFSILAEHRGLRDETMILNAGATGRDLLNKLSEDLPMLATYRSHVRLAVNHSYADPDTVLQNNDEVAFITPVSGG